MIHARDILRIEFHLYPYVTCVFIISQNFFVYFYNKQESAYQKESQYLYMVDFENDTKFHINILDRKIDSSHFDVEENYNHYSVVQRKLSHQDSTEYLGYPGIKNVYTTQFLNWDEGISYTEVISIPSHELIGNYFPSKKYNKLLRGLINEKGDEINVKTISIYNDKQNTISEVRSIDILNFDSQALLSKLRQGKYDEELDRILSNLISMP